MNEKPMKATIEVDLTELREYRDELNSLISMFEEMNKRYQERVKAVEDLGYPEDEVMKILHTLFAVEE